MPPKRKRSQGSCCPYCQLYFSRVQQHVSKCTRRPISSAPTASRRSTRESNDTQGGGHEEVPPPLPDDTDDDEVVLAVEKEDQVRRVTRSTTLAERQVNNDDPDDDQPSDDLCLEEDRELDANRYKGALCRGGCSATLHFFQ